MSFINAIFLFGLGAALLPVLFHLVRRVRAKQVRFSSLMFLKMTPKEVVRRRRIKDWLLMAIRGLLLALLALIFARPFIPKDSIPFFATEQAESVVVLVDNSFSMQYGDLFEQARAAALGIVDAAGPDDEVAIVAFSDEPRQLTALGTDKSLHRNVLTSALEPTYRPTDFFRPIQLAQELLAEARHEAQRIVLITDMQRTGWGGAFENWKLEQGVGFEVIPLGDAGRENTYIGGLAVGTRRVEGEVINRFDSRIGASGEGTPAGLSLALTLDNAVVEESEVPASTAGRVSFQYRPEREGVFLGSLHLADDALPADNTHYFALDVRSRPALLGIDGSNDARNDAYYLDRAFNQGDAALYGFTRGAAGDLTGGRMASQAVVFVSNVPALGAAQRSALLGYLERGGSVVLSFGDASDPAGLSAALAELGIGQPTGRIQARTVQGGPAIIGDVDIRHPIFSLFAQSSAGAIFRPQFREYMRIVPDSSATVVGRYDSGDPFLIEQTVGAGRVLVYTSTFNADWTDFPINELYIPFVYQLVKYALEGQERRLAFLIGEPVRLQGEPGETWDVRTPDDRQLRVTLDADGVGFFRDTGLPGHYAAAQGNQRFPFAVNVDVAESDLSTRDLAEAIAAVVPPPDDVARTVEMARTMEVEDEERKQKFWRYLLMGMIGLFAAETFLANRKRVA
ncbi:MAG: VWA domain-containing protein [Rhodothermales bacterium]|nr:VWA domain-containing protein [Rhodothermales bacterium]